RLTNPEVFGTTFGRLPRITLASLPMPERAPDGTRPSQPEAPQKVGLAEAYAALKSLLRASPRGRWFLAEFARRNRAAETDMLLDAIGRIDGAVLYTSHPARGH